MMMTALRALLMICAALAQDPTQGGSGLPQALLTPGAPLPADVSSTAPDLAAGLTTVLTELSVRPVHTGAKGKPSAGDLILLTVSPGADLGEGALVLEAKKLETDPVEWGDARILGWKPFDAKSGSILLILTTYHPGKLTIKSIPFYRDDKPIFATQPKEIEFGAVGGDKTKDDIYQPLALALPLWVIILLALVILLLVLTLLWWLSRWYKKRKSKIEELAKAPRVLSPPEEFEQTRKDAELRGYLDKGNYKPYYFALSDACKKFLGKSYRFDAEERTTRELLFELEKLGMGVDLLDQWERLFDEMDIVKFTDQAPPLEVARGVGGRLSQAVTLSYAKSPLLRELMAQQAALEQQKQKQQQQKQQQKQQQQKQGSK